MLLIIFYVFYPRFKSEKNTTIIVKFLSEPVIIDDIPDIPEGYTGALTYAMPLKVNKWKYINNFENMEIFTHGVSKYEDLTNDADIISIALSGHNNDLFIKVKTIELGESTGLGPCPGDKNNPTENDSVVNQPKIGFEEIKVDYVPIGKYFHLILVLSQIRLDIYVNGRLYKTHKFVNRRGVGVNELSTFRWKQGTHWPDVTTGCSKGKFEYFMKDLNVPELKKIYRRGRINDNNGKRYICNSDTPESILESSNQSVSCDVSNKFNNADNLQKFLLNNLNSENSENSEESESLMKNINDSISGLFSGDETTEYTTS